MARNDQDGWTSWLDVRSTGFRRDDALLARRLRPVVGVNEQVTVPAGTVSAVLIEKLGGTSTKRYWFVRGVGKVKEESGSQLEELTSYMLVD